MTERPTPARAMMEAQAAFRSAARGLSREPGPSLTAVIVLALAIGANTAVFSLVNAVLLRPLPYEKPDRLVMIWDRVERLGLEKEVVSPPNYLDWEARNRVFAAMGAYTEEFFDVRDGSGATQRIAGLSVTPTFFRTLGVSPALGAVFAPGDGRAAGGPTPAIISHGLWQRRFGSDPTVIGRSIALSGIDHPIVGVLPRAFQFSGKRVDAFLPLSLGADQVRDGRGRRYLTVVARLKEGVSVAQAQADMDGVTARLAEQYPDVDRGRSAAVRSLEKETLGRARETLLLLQGAVGLVLLMAAGGVANLQLARGLSRRKDLAIRAALGATRRRLVGEMLAEGVLLALAGGLLGTVGAAWGTRTALWSSPASLPIIGNATVDGRVSGFAATMAVLSSVIFGLLPALHASRPDLHESLKDAGRGAIGGRDSRTQRALVVLEVALSLVLLAGAGLLIKSLAELQRVDPGFVADDVLAVDLSLPSRYATPEARARFFEEVARRMQDLPGVEAAAVTSHLPLSGEDGSRRFRISRDSTAPPIDLPAAEYRRVTTRYFRAMRIPVVRGRAFTEADTATAPGVVIVNRAFAQHFFPGEDALRHRVWIEDGPPRLREIVGVVGDVRHFGLDAAARPEMYVPQVDRPWPNMTLVVRAESGPPERLVNQIRREITAMDENLPLANVKTMGAYLAESTAQRRMTARLLGAFAAAALLLATLGLHGLMSYAVAQRVREMAIRMALGAGRAQVVRLVVGDGLRLTAIGLGIGLCAVFMAAPVIASQLYGVGAHDPVVLLGVGGLLVGVGLAACYLPARRAARTDPMRCARL